MREDDTVLVDLSGRQSQGSEDEAVGVGQNNVAEAAHDLGDQPGRDDARRDLRPAPEAQLDHALPGWLAHSDQTRALQMLAQQHDKGRRLGGQLARLFAGQVDASELWMSGNDQPAVASAAP